MTAEQIGSGVRDAIQAAVGDDPATVVDVAEENGTVTVVIRVSTEDPESINDKVAAASYPSELGTVMGSEVRLVGGSDKKSSSSNIPIIAGAAAGGAVVVVGLAVGVFCYISKKKKASLDAHMTADAI